MKFTMELGSLGINKISEINAICGKYTSTKQISLSNSFQQYDLMSRGIENDDLSAKSKYYLGNTTVIFDSEVSLLVLLSVLKFRAKIS